MSTSTALTDDVIDSWADDLSGPVALCMKQRLAPVEGEDGVIFPPTYADVGYNIDTLSDGTKVATIDSVGSQANRMEPIFKAAKNDAHENRFAALVPQIAIDIGNDRVVSILDAGHRLGDAIVRASTLRDKAKAAFERYLEKGDALEIAKLAPTSLVFGVWDSRDTAAKLPRIVQSVVRAWNVDELHRSAVYCPPTDYSTLDVFSEEDKEKGEKDSKSPLAKRGFVHVPASWALGGVVVRGPIVRDVTVNLIALRRLDAHEMGKQLRRYVLGLSLVAATEPCEAFLRQGCLLTPKADEPAVWQVVSRDGGRHAAKLSVEQAFQYASEAAKSFGVGDSMSVQFKKDMARADVADGGEGAKKKARASKAKG